MRTKKTTCSKCDQPGFKFRGDRWLCVKHNRFDMMIFTAHKSGKYVPRWDELERLADDLEQCGMTCPTCEVAMTWTGRRGDPSRLSLQHDRSGSIRFMCMLCNSRHDDLPGDSFYDLPKNHWRCARCKNVLHRDMFHPGKSVSYCKECVSVLNKIMWAKHGHRWARRSHAHSS